MVFDIQQELSERFARGDVAVDDFLKDYMEKRKLYHKRSFKSKKLDELLKQQHY